MSKQFTAAAVMLLVESGRLDLREPIDRWLPDAPRQWRRITLHHLLSHTAGIAHWREAPGLDPAEVTTIDRRLAAIQAAPLRSEPGAEWHYSSPAFLVVGLIVERAAGEPYHRFITERILARLQLTQTTLGAIPNHAAVGYEAGRRVAPFDLDTMPGTGDIWSTAGDVTRFTTALHGGELITATSLRSMCTVHAPIDDDDHGEPELTTIGYGYGMFNGIFAGHAAFYHPGDNPGYRSLACWIPDREASIAILVNDDSVSVMDLLRQLLPMAIEP